MTLSDSIRLWQTGDAVSAASACVSILERNPEDPEALHLLSRLALAAGKRQQALALVDRAIVHAPEISACLVTRGDVLRAWRRLPEALLSYEEALRRAPDNLEALANRGGVLLLQGRLGEALDAFDRAARRAPDCAPLHVNRAIVLMRCGRLQDALAACDRALHLAPGLAQGHSYRGMVLRRLDRTEEALAALAEALRLDPANPETLNNYGVALSSLGRAQDAYTAFAEAIRIDPSYPEAQHNLADSLKDLGRFAEAAAAFRHALQLKPDFPRAESALLFCLNYDSSCDDHDLFEAHRAWGQRRQLTLPPVASYPNAPLPERTLRVGLVSCEFMRAPVGVLLHPVLIAADRHQLEFFCYADGHREDDLTLRLRQEATSWRRITDLPDQSVAAAIREDGIDILIDLNGHTQVRGMALFALKPAPIQVSWLGYPCTTGLGAIDYVLMDEAAVPCGAERWFVEEVVRLPKTRFCYGPPEYAPPPGPPPVLATGRITLGSFNNLSKVTPEVLEVWARVLRAVPGSRLLLKWKTLADLAEQARWRGLLAGLGIEPARLELRGRSPHDRMLAEYAEVDIALDPFPYSGGITSLEALWQGVPVVTMPGARPVSRQTLGFLRVLGMDELVASGPDEYVRIATALAQDRERLVSLRQGQRARMASSALCDGARFAWVLEDALRAMWRRWCLARAGHLRETTPTTA